MGAVRVFVYGSLKRGFRHHDRIVRARREGPARTEPGYRLVRYHGYPALAPAGRAEASAGKVEGETYWVEPAHLAELDEFEDCPVLYQRAVIGLEDGSEAMAYVITPSEAARHPTIAASSWSED